MFPYIPDDLTVNQPAEYSTERNWKN